MQFNTLKTKLKKVIKIKGIHDGTLITNQDCLLIKIDYSKASSFKQKQIPI